MDERSRYLEYLIKRLGRRRRWGLTLIVVILLSLGLAQAEIELVGHYSYFSIPQRVARYMLDTTINHFDPSTLKRLVRASGAPNGKAATLLLLYYSYYLFEVLVAVSIFGLTSLTASIIQLEQGQGRQSHELALKHSFVRAMRLYACVDTMMRESNRSLRRRAIGLSSSLRLPRALNPFKRDWRQAPSLNWISHETLSTDTSHILAAIHGFRTKASYCTRTGSDLQRLRTALDALVTFLYISCIKIETRYRSPDAQTTSTQAYETLVRFANVMNRIEFRGDHERHIVDQIKTRMTSYLISPELQVLIPIAIMAAAVIALGSVVFQIPLKTAFLTWFSVVFGSFVISVGLRK